MALEVCTVQLFVSLLLIDQAELVVVAGAPLDLLGYTFVSLGFEIINHQLLPILRQTHRTYIMITILILFVQTLIIFLTQDLIILHELLKRRKVNLCRFTLSLHHFIVELVGSCFCICRVQRAQRRLLLGVLFFLVQQIARFDLAAVGCDLLSHVI